MFSKRVETLIEGKTIETYAFLRILRKELPNFIPKNFPLVDIIASNINHINVYKNIQFDTTKVKRKIYLNESTFKPTLITVKKTPSNITEYQYLKTLTSFRLTSFLTKYLKLAKYGFKDNEIRDLAQKIMNTLHKGLVGVVVCDTPKDHIALYKIAYSCMSPKSNYSATWLKTYLYKNHGLWPSMWYHYNPHTKGIFLQFGNKGVSRAILIRQNINAPFREYWRSIYSESLIYNKMFVDVLHKKGFRSRSSNIDVTCYFKVPAIQVFDKPICPLPFHDCIRSLSCRFDKKENVFYFGSYGRFTNLRGSYCYEGYIDSSLNPAHETISRR